MENKKNRVWMRLGAYVQFTDEEVKRIVEYNGIPSDIMMNAVKDGRVVLEGDSYVPDVAGNCFVSDVGDAELEPSTIYSNGLETYIGDFVVDLPEIPIIIGR